MTNITLTRLKKSLGLLLIFSSVHYASFAQEADSNENSEYYVTSTKGVKLSVLAPILTFQYEHPIGPKTVLDFNAGMALSFSSSKSTISLNDNDEFSDKSNEYAFSPILTFGVKHFYNFAKRQERGKNIQNNSANYFGSRVVGILLGWHNQKSVVNGIESKASEFSTDGAVVIAPVWGINRHMGNKFNFNLELGPSLVINEEVGYGAWINVGFSKSF
ncbi:hypothetical protein [Sphingobacterium sp. 1.A.5]|jgi:hypothetical protein|uniref:hypothetical protein n=1 Tax=Sphingobacterium sp. 1.A.5 TaxID=2044604 RepID=UPI000C0BC5FF|nr:hypothetical protein [Sphingobacterium sp. 1.A.5]